jgi:hypothetical protein
VTLTPTPVTGHSFAGWSGSCVGTGPCTLVMRPAMKTAAKFSAPCKPFLAGGRWEAPRSMPLVGVLFLLNQAGVPSVARTILLQ